MEKRSQEFHITLGRVPLSDVDPGQVVYHGNYFRIYNHARDENIKRALTY